MSNKINYLSKNKIDDYINNNLNIAKINKIYGGQTSRTLEERKNEHISKDSRFKNINIYEITNCKTKNLNQSKYIEDYLISKLNEKFAEKCINDRNNNGSIAHRGGAGQNNLNIYHTFYVMYK